MSITIEQVRDPNCPPEILAEALRESEERYMLAIQGANDGIWDWNIQTDEMYYSPRWAEILQYQPGEISNQPNEWINRIHPEDAKRRKAYVRIHFI